MKKIILGLLLVLGLGINTMNGQGQKWKYIAGLTYELTEDNQFISYQKGEEVSRVNLTKITDTGSVKAYKEEDELYERMYRFIDYKKRTYIHITVIDKFSREVSKVVLNLKKVK